MAPAMTTETALASEIQIAGSSDGPEIAAIIVSQPDSRKPPPM